jgi:hypothetical protein
MSRYCGDKNAEPILNASEHWKQVGLLSDGSVFDAGQIWVLPHLDALDEYFINKLDLGEGNFYDKLETQLESTAPEVKQLAVEMLWLMLLCPSKHRFVKKTRRDNDHLELVECTLPGGFSLDCG